MNRKYAIKRTTTEKSYSQTLKEERLRRNTVRYHPAIAVDYRKIIDMVVSITGMNKHIVHDSIMHSFLNLKKWLSNPQFKSRIAIPELGAFTLNKYALTQDIKSLIPVIRRCTDPVLREKLINYFRLLWSYRQLCVVYEHKTTVDNWKDQSKRPKEKAKQIKNQ